MKKKLGRRKGEWADHLYEVLWEYRNTKRSPTEETPFTLAFGVDAVISVEIESTSFRVENYNSGLNNKGMKLHLDLLQEKRDDARVTIAAYQQKTAQYFNRRVKPRKFGIGDWVLRKVKLATRDSEGKLAPTWERPYQVIGCHQGGAYHLETRGGKKLLRPWNAESEKNIPMNVIVDVLE